MSAVSGGPQVMHFSTAAYRDREATDAWREVFGRSVLRIDISPLSAEFRAEAKALVWPGFGLLHAVTSAVHLANSSALIASDDLCFGKVSYMADPTRPSLNSQLGRESELFVGDGVLFTKGEFGTGTLPSDCRYMAFSIPSSALRPLVPDMDTWFARRIPGASPEMRMLSRYLELADEEHLATSELRQAFAHHVVDLLALALGATRDAAELAQARGGRAARLHAMKQDIQQALGRPNLSVGRIAALHNVTPRYVQKLFEESGTTFTCFVLDRRLDGVCRALSDPLRASVPISAIAYEAGFADLSHFNRAFRQRYGCTPSDIRSGAASASRKPS